MSVSAILPMVSVRHTESMQGRTELCLLKVSQKNTQCTISRPREVKGDAVNISIFKKLWPAGPEGPFSTQIWSGD